MKIAILCVGKLREAFWRDAAAEYGKRLSRFDTLEVIEVPDLPEPKNASRADVDRVVDAEGLALLSHVRPRDHVIALCIEGKACTSEAFAARLADLEMAGVGRIVYVIGGSNGLSGAVRKRANERLSFSPMTFPHQLARVLLLEQLFRARKINANETYHK